MIVSAIADKLKHQSKDDFKGRHFEARLIVQVVDWYLPYPLSYRDQEGMFLERDFEVDHGTIDRWILAHVPLNEKRLRWFRKALAFRGIGQSTMRMICSLAYSDFKRLTKLGIAGGHAAALTLSTVCHKSFQNSRQPVIDTPVSNQMRVWQIVVTGPLSAVSVALCIRRMTCLPINALDRCGYGWFNNRREVFILAFEGFGSLGIGWKKPFLSWSW